MASRTLSTNSSSSSLSSTSTSLSSASTSTSATSLHSSSSSSLVPPRKRASPPPVGSLGCASAGVSKRKAALPTKLQLAMKGTPREVAAAALAAAKKEKETSEYRALQQQVQGLCEPQYVDEVRSYMHEMEGKTKAAVETIDMQPELQWYMRPYLLDFLIEIHQQYRLRPETLYLAVNVIDRYVSKRIVYKKHYQLVGCAALWIAAKFEDAKDRVPTVQELGQMCCGAYEESAFIQMEGHVLSTIGWVLGHPTAEAWLRLKCSAEPGLGLEEQKTQHVARFLMEITLFHRAFVGLKASDTANASLLLARFILHKSRRPLEEVPEVLQVVQLLDAHLADHLESVSAIVVKKYSFSYYSRAATLVREFYLSGHRFVPVSLPASAPLARSASSLSACSVSTDSALSSPTSSCGMISSPRSTSSDGMCCNDQDACCCLCVGAQSDSIVGNGADCSMYTEYEEDVEELPRYVAVDSFKGVVTVKENLRERDVGPPAVPHSKEAVSAVPREALRDSGWDANTVPMSC